MTSLITDRRRLRWLAPVGVAVLAVAGTALAGGRADADVDLQPRSAAQLLTDVQASLQDGAPGLSGTVVQTSNLGLPELPAAGPQAGTDLTSTLSGTHTWRVWYAGPDQARLALVGDLGESDVIRNGSDLWLWSSADRTAVHHTLPERGADRAAAPTPVPSLPADAARGVLSMIEPTTEVSTPGGVTVAGRSAYQLVLTPRSSTTLVERVTLAVDAEEHVPLRVQVYSTRAAEPAFEVGFTSVDFATPDERQFAFTPPPGTTVTEADHSNAGGAPASPDAGPDATGKRPMPVGTGWDTVLVGPAGSAPVGSVGSGGSGGTDGSGDGGTPGAGAAQQLSGILDRLPEASGSWGSGHVLEGTLFTAVVTDDGRIAVGAVPPATVYAALASAS